jgi:hypothetical protein
MTIIGPVTLNGGTMTGGGTISIDGRLTWMEGTMTDFAPTNGVTNANGGIRLGGLPTGLELNRRTLNNRGLMTFVETGPSILLTLNNGAVFNNSGTVEIRGDHSIIWNSGPFSTINNSGLFQKALGTGATEVAFPIAFNNTGTLEVQRGTLRLGGGGDCGSSCSGTFTVASGARLEFTFGTFTLGGTIGGAGTVSFRGGTENVTGTYGITAGTTISGATVHFTGHVPSPSPGPLTVFDGWADFSNVEGAITLPGLSLGTAGTLTGTSTQTIRGLFDWNGGRLCTSSSPPCGPGPTNGFTDALGGIRLGGLPASPELHRRTLHNHGIAELVSTGPDVQLFLNEGADFRNSGIIDIHGNHSIVWNSGASSMLNNFGLIQKSAGTGTATIGFPIIFNNAQTVEVQSGTLQLTGSYTQTAGSTILNGGALTSSSSPLDIQGGRLSGFGDLRGNVMNGAIVRPGTETATGTLNVSLVDGCMPASGSSFVIMTYNSHMDTTFATTNLPALPDGLTWNVQYGANSVVLSVQ